MYAHKRLLVLAVAAVLVVASATTALADDVEGARASFAEGKKAYNIGEYEGAIAHYKEGYSLAPRPEFLYNIGQCYYQLKNWERARFFYERYLSESPDSGDATEVRAIIDELDARIAEEGSTAPPPDDGYDRPPDDGSPDGYGADGSEPYYDDGSSTGDGYAEPGPEPAPVRAAVSHSKRILVTASLGYMPTTRCIGGSDCFLGLEGTFNLRLWNPPKFMTLFLDIPFLFIRDNVGGNAGGTENSLLVGAGIRARFDKWFRFVPYARANLLVGGGSYVGTSVVRAIGKLAVGGEISIRNGRGGGGLGIFGEVGWGSGWSNIYNPGVGGAGYNQFFIQIGASFP